MKVMLDSQEWELFFNYRAGGDVLFTMVQNLETREWLEWEDFVLDLGLPDGTVDAWMEQAVARGEEALSERL